MKSFYILFVLLIHSGAASAQQYLIATVAGTGGSPGWSGDTGPALNAQFTNPLRVALDAQGDLYITDYSNQSVRRVDANTDIVTTVAGNGAFGYSGDGITADGAELADPHDVVVDAAGNVYIADTRNSRVRVVNTSGIINTFAGNGTPGYSGDGGPATNAQLMFPSGLALDKSGNLYIADYGNATVRRVDKNGNISTFAGVGFAVYGAAPGDGGLATNAYLEQPYCVQLDSAGNLYIGDIGTSSIRKVSTNGIITTFLQNFQAQNFAIDPASNFYVANYHNHTVLKILPGGSQLWIAGDGIAGYSGDGGPGTAAQLSVPYGVAVDPYGNVFIADSVNAVIRELSPSPSTLGGVANAANLVAFAPPVAGSGDASVPVAPGEIVVLFGTGLGPANLIVASPSKTAFGKQLAGTTVTFNGIAAPIIYTSSTIVAAIVPYGLNGSSSAQVVVSYQGHQSSLPALPVAVTAPGIFTSNASGTGQAAVMNEDGTVNSPSNPAPIGSIITFFETGEGQTTPSGVDGQLANNTNLLPAPIQSVVVTIGDLPAVVDYAGAAPFEVAGVMQCNVQIPSGVSPSGSVPMQVNIGGVISPIVTISVSAQ
jgi:uncharacterized protein (TIGR03437 family)